ncbi:hypothetical protein ACOME3_006125 [Neoechinorhynchus agilis]
MVHNCIVSGCRFRKRKNIKGGVMFHSFPSDQPRLRRWETIVQEHCDRDVKVTKHSKICQFHFKNEDYQVPFNPTSPHETRRNKHLKSSAIPSIFGLAATLAAEEWDTVHCCSKVKKEPVEIHRGESNAGSTSAAPLPPEPDPFVSSNESRSSAENKSKRLNGCIDRLRAEVTQSNPIFDPSTMQQSSVFNPTSSIHNFFSIPMFTRPKNEVEFNEMLERYSLMRYYQSFIAIGADDLRQLAEMHPLEIKRLLDSIGMADKPFHVKRFEAMLADYRKQQAIQNSSFNISNISCQNNPYGQVLPLMGETFIGRLEQNSILGDSAQNESGIKNRDMWTERRQRIETIETERNNLKQQIVNMKAWPSSHRFAVNSLDELEEKDKMLSSEYSRLRKLIRKHEGRVRHKQRQSTVSKNDAEHNAAMDLSENNGASSDKTNDSIKQEIDKDDKSSDAGTGTRHY